MRRIQIKINAGERTCDNCSLLFGGDKDGLPGRGYCKFFPLRSKDGLKMKDGVPLRCRACLLAETNLMVG